MKQMPVGYKTAINATAAVVIGFVAACGPTPSSSSSPTPSSIATESPSPSVATTAVASPTPDPTAGWVTYTSTINHLTFQHPADMNPLECGWVFINPPTNPPTLLTSCPQGDGFCCVFLRSSDNGETGQMSLISDHPSLYPGGIQRTSVIVDGVSGIRLSGTQTIGQGGGPQVEYDFTTRERTYNLFAYIGGQSDSLDAAGPSAALFDQIVQTVTFSS